MTKKIRSAAVLVASAVTWGTAFDAAAHTRLDYPAARDMTDGYKDSTGGAPCGMAERRRNHRPRSRRAPRWRCDGPKPSTTPAAFWSISPAPAT